MTNADRGEGCRLVRPLGIIHRRGKDLSSTTRRFIELLQNHSAPLDKHDARTSGAAAPRECEPSNGRGVSNGRANGHAHADGDRGGEKDSKRPTRVTAK